MGINWEKIQELSKQKPDTRATAWKVKLDWELEKVASFYFHRQLTIRMTYSGIQSILQVEGPNNFLNIDRQFCYWVNAAWKQFPNTFPTSIVDLAQKSWDGFPQLVLGKTPEQPGSLSVHTHHQGIRKSWTPCHATKPGLTWWTRTNVFNSTLEKESSPGAVKVDVTTEWHEPPRV